LVEKVEEVEEVEEVEKVEGVEGVEGVERCAVEVTQAIEAPRTQAQGIQVSSFAYAPDYAYVCALVTANLTIGASGRKPFVLTDCNQTTKHPAPKTPAPSTPAPSTPALRNKKSV
jgi:hypothetical protein